MSAIYYRLVLGNMNGLRGIFEQAHADLGSHCSTELLDWVVTVGEKANMYLAPAARQKGCQVKECRNAIEAGAFVRDKLKSEGIALFKGSSGGVWLEEAIKINLHRFQLRQRPVAARASKAGVEQMLAAVVYFQRNGAAIGQAAGWH